MGIQLFDIGAHLFGRCALGGAAGVRVLFEGGIEAGAEDVGNTCGDIGVAGKGLGHKVCAEADSELQEVAGIGVQNLG